MGLKLILGLLLFGVAVFAQCTGTDRCVQQAVATGADGSVGVTATFGTVLSAGNSVVVILSRVVGVKNTLAVVLVGGGAETLITDLNQTGTNTSVTILHVHNVAGGSTGVTATTSATSRVSLNATEWKGLTNAASEGTNSKSALLDAAPNTLSVTPASASNVAIAVGGWTADDYSAGPTNGFSRLTPTGGGLEFQEGAYIQQSTATAQSTGWTLTAGINWAAGIAVFGTAINGPTNAQRSAGFWIN
jgi:hypothetical protein